MSSGNTETRILQMQLENKDFEEGVRQTIKSLESLEEKLNLKNAGDGFEKVSAAANSVQMGHLESGLDAVTNKFTLMGQIGLQVLERISSKVIDTGEKILRAATIQPMLDGWSEFEMKTNSVQTILGGIRNQFEDQPAAIDAISEALDNLNDYADKTIYSFAQMTENVGKFTNQGLDLDTSTNAIKGIANWAAAVGANPQQMSRAMYNISQSLGAGHMQRIDWRSIMFANMATPEVKKLFAEVAKRQGTLDPSGTVKIGKQTFDVMQDFEETLKQGWMTNEVIAEGLGIYAKAFSEAELIEKYGEELGKQFYEMGVYAEEAATKVRTFTQLIGVLKESLGSGWASTFDILFGGFEQQTEFLTSIKERIEDIINFQTEDRNTWLQNFSDIGGIKVFQDVILGTIDILSDFYWVFNDVAALVLNPFGQSVFNMSDGIFGPRQEGYTEMQKTWEGVKGIFDDISNSLSNFRRWMYTPNEKSGRSPIHNLANALSGVAGAAGIAAQVLGGFSKLVTRLFKRFEPLVSSVLDLLGQIGGAIYNVFFNLTGQQSIEKVFDKIGDAIEPVIDFVVGLASAIVDLIHSFLGIDEAADDWTVLAERMEAFWDIFEYNPDLTFLENLKYSVQDVFKVFFGEEAANNLIQGWDENIAPVLEQISGFFTQAGEDIKKHWAKLYEYLFGQETTVMTGPGKSFTYRKGGLIQNIKEYFTGESWSETLDSIETTFTTVSEKIGNAWTKLYDFLYGQETTVMTGPGRSFTYRSGGAIKEVLDFFASETWQSDWAIIQGAFESISNWVTTTGEAAWKTIMDFLFGPETTVMTGPGQSFTHRTGGAYSEALRFLDPVWEWIEITGSKLYDYITTHDFNEMWKDLNDLLFGYETVVMTGPGQSFTHRTGGVLTPIVEMLAPISEAFANAKAWGLEKLSSIDWGGIWASVKKLFEGYDTTVFDQSGRNIATEHHDGIFERIANFFDRIVAWYDEHKGTFEKVFNWISGLGSELWGAFEGLLSGQGLGGFGSVGTYLMGGFEKLIGKIFPEGFDLSGIFDGLFGGEGSLLDKLLGGNKDVNKAVDQAAKSEGGGILDRILGLFMGSAGAEESEVSAASENYLNLLELTKTDVDNAADKGTGIMDSILGSVSKFLPYIGVAGGIALVGKVGDMITGITGNRKPTIIEQIASLFRAIGEPLKGLGIAIAAAGFSEKVSPGAIDKVFGHIQSILTTVFGWVAGTGVGGSLLSLLGNFFGSKGILKLTNGKGQFSFESVSSVLSGIGEGISGLFEGMQTLFNLTWEVMGADILMGAENFDKRIERVLGFVGKIITTITGNAWPLEVVSAVNAFGSALMPGEKEVESLSSIMMGLGAMISGLGDGISALMTASILPGMMGVDFQNIIDVINAVFSGLNTLLGLSDVMAVIGAATKGKGGLFSLEMGAGLGAGISSFLGFVGGTAIMLFDWFSTTVTKNMEDMAPRIYNFAANFSSAMKALSSIKGSMANAAAEVISQDLPTILRTFTSDDIGYDKAVIDERGKTIRDFGNRVKVAIGSLSAAKDAFDKYNTDGEDSFPLAFFKSLTAALEYLKTGGIKELYDEFFSTGFGGGAETEEQEKGILGVMSFFETMDHLGYAITQYDNTDIWGHRTSGTKLESTKQYLDDFSEAFTGIQTTFSLLVDDMGKDGFSAENITAVGDFLKKVSEAGKTLAEAYLEDSVTWGGTVFTKHAESSPIMNMGSFLNTIGAGIRDLDNALKTNGKYDINYKQLEDALNAIKPMMEIEQMLRGYASMTGGEPEFVLPELTWFGGSADDLKKNATDLTFTSSEWESATKHWIDDVIPRMTQLGEGLHSLAAEIKPEDISALGSASGTLNSLASFMSQDLYTSIQTMSTDQIGAYAAAFEALKQSLLIPEGANTMASIIQGIMGAAGANGVQLRIVPIVDDSNFGWNYSHMMYPGGMSMENTYSRMIAMQMSTNDVQNVRVDASQIGSLVTANNQTRDRIESLASAIRQIKISINLPSTGYGPRSRNVEVYPLVANYQSPYGP